jgi:A/G-specific adenine glycosylase
MQKAARQVVEQYDGVLPDQYEALLDLTGIGSYTAGAIASIAYGKAVPAVDGNVLRVISRISGNNEDVLKQSVKKKYEAALQQVIPENCPGAFNQALMELGATLCCPGTPKCDLCPWNELCDACLEGDADVLPIHEKKKPPKQMDMAVCLITLGGRILTLRRSERMLKGLTVFWLIEDENRPGPAEALLHESGLNVCFVQEMGEAKHVFTHRVWNMKLFHFELEKEPDEAWLDEHQARLVSREEMEQLPFPSAMGAAVEAAKKII